MCDSRAVPTAEKFMKTMAVGKTLGIWPHDTEFTIMIMA